LFIEPQTEIYVSKLFQGKIFHRIKEIYSMSCDNLLCSIDFTRAEGAFSENFSPEMILGNPYARDAMLQTAQLTESRMYLPIKIAQLTVYATASENIHFTLTHVEKRFDKEIQHNVSVLDKFGTIIEEIHGYVSKQVGIHKMFVEPEDFASPNKNDQLIFTTKYDKVKEIFSLDYPKLFLAYEEELWNGDKEARHQVEQRILNISYKRNDLKNVLLTWDNMGKPVLADNDFVSFSHNQAHILISTGKTEQGCDLEMVESRSRDEWNRLLGKHHVLLDLLIQEGDTLDQAGTRIWSILESYFKAYAQRADTIIIESAHNEALLFKVSAESHVASILTFSMKFTRNREKIVALIVIPKVESKQKLHMADTEDFNGFFETFRVTFKDSTLLQKLVDYTMFAIWMGKLRESALFEIGNMIVQDSCSGIYAWVTNNSKIEVYGTISSFDLLEGKVWTSQRFGSKNSSNILHFEWNKINNDGTKERVAYCEMSTTWVTIKDHGIVEASAYPDYLDTFMLRIERSKFSKFSSEQLAENKFNQKTDLKLSENVLYKAKNTPLIKPMIHTEYVQTSMKHANLIGNVYFAHYYEWQKLCIDKYIYNIVPDLYKGIGKDGELFVIHSEVNHLREAMPFYTIKITMHLKTLYDNGMEFSFNYYGTVDQETDEWVKLANGSCRGVWSKKIDDKLVAVKLPDSIVAVTKKECNLLSV
jgi:acyl-CoA thioesterase FadM